MTKGQDALKHWKETNTEMGVTHLPLFVVELIEKELKELQAIKETKLSKALECLEFLKQQAVAFEHNELAIKVANENYDTIKPVLLEAKQLKKAWEIVKEKGVDVATFNTYQTVIEYNWSIRFEKYKRKELIQEEFDLLKEVLSK